MSKNIVGMISGLVFAGLIGCGEVDIKPAPKQEANSQVVEFKIRKGEHDSRQLALLRLNVPAIIFQAKFDSTAIYSASITKNQADINKLYGLSDCNPCTRKTARVLDGDGTTMNYRSLPIHIQTKFETINCWELLH